MVELGRERQGAALPDDGPSARLHELEAITDTALARLAVEDFLTELLERVRGILEADTAAVLLYEESTQELVATAACGIEEEVREGVRVPFGRGFAGAIAARRAPVALDRVDSTTVTNPILWEKGIQVMLGVPLLLGDRLLGVLHVGRLRNQRFTPHDQELLEVVAERVAGASQARQVAFEEEAARLLENSLLPDKLPESAELAIAARYLTPEAPLVGGDWYDLFTAPTGSLWVVAGDVAGHGLPAAIIMGRVRTALRAYALLGDTPAKALELTDRKCTHFEYGTIITAVCAISTPPYRHWQIVSAGHLPPMIAASGRPSSLVELPVGPPLGLDPNFERSTATVTLDEGDLMLVYTDGLVERRGESIDAGIERLRTALRPAAPDEVCRQIVHDLVGAEMPNDDVVLVAIQRVLQG